MRSAHATLFISLHVLVILLVPTHPAELRAYHAPKLGGIMRA